LNEIAVVLLAAGAAGVATLALLPQITAIPRERWARAALGPVFLQSALGALVPGVLAIALRAPVAWALGFAIAGGALAIARMAMRYAPIRAVKRLTGALAIESERPRAMAAIGPALDRARPSSGDAQALGSWAQAALIGAAYLIDADEPEAARDVLERMKALTFRGVSQANHALLWAHVEIFALDMTAARSALASVQKPIAMPLLAAHDEVLEALALACEGQPEAALAKVDGWKHAEHWYGKLRLTVRVVAYALQGEEPARARTEAELTRRFGRRATAAAKKLVDGYTHAD
jgi:hypothetical protein